MNKKIINALLDIYERRSESLTGERLKRKVALKVDKHPLLKPYFTGFNTFAFRCDVEDALKELGDLIYVIRELDSDLICEIILNEQQLNAAYLYVERTKKLDLYTEKCHFIAKKLTELSPTSLCFAYLKKVDPATITLDNIQFNAHLIESIEGQEEEILLRNFSKKKFGDSKLFEKKASLALRLFNEISPIPFLSFDELCKNYHIIKNKGYAYIKNGLVFKINDQMINLDKLQLDYSLSEEAINQLSICAISKRKVITIENLTTFYYFNDDDAVVIFLAGYSSSVKLKLLEKINQFNPHLKWYHIGDIDWGGIQIFLDLKKKTGIKFTPLYMGVAELKKYRDETIPLSEEEIKKLQNIESEEFQVVIAYMIKHRIKLEQESLVFN